MTPPWFRPFTDGHRPVVAICGPDGAGKTTLVRKLRDGLADKGFVVRLGYGYGCILCRRIDRPSGVAGAAAASGPTSRGPSPAGSPATMRRPTWRTRLSHLLHNVHGHVDAYELVVRLMLLRLAALVSTPAVVVTDRGPLDGLAKHDPPPGSLLAQRYLRLTSRYDLIVLLDAPADLLAQRDGEHGPEELERWRVLYRWWAEVAAAAGGAVVVADTVARAPGSIARDLCRIVTSTRSPIAGDRSRSVHSEIDDSSLTPEQDGQVETLPAISRRCT